MDHVRKTHDGNQTTAPTVDTLGTPDMRRETPPEGWTPEQVREVLRWVVDPELHINIVDLGLVYGVEVEGATVTIRMTLTSPGCPYGEELLANVHDTLRLMLKGISRVVVKLVWEPVWGPQMMDEDLRVELGFDVGSGETKP